MAEVNYAFIKDGFVVNVAAFEDPTDPQLLLQFKEEFLLDDIILATETSSVGGEYDGETFWLPQPHPSWIKNPDTKYWTAPVPYPTDNKNYIWNEETVSWIPSSL
jgi:hypothetical protein